MKSLFLCSFASLDLSNSVKRLRNQANQSKFYKFVKIYRPYDLNDKNKSQIKKLMNRKKRLYGYASWKPEIIRDCLKRIPKDSILQYSDVGCHINEKGKKRLDYYKKITDKKNILAFQYFKPKFRNKEKLKIQIYYEYKYTKNDLFEYLKIPKKSKIFKSEQFWSGTIFFKNNKYSQDFLKRWIKICRINKLIDDTPSKSQNSKNFVEHRHDQSAFSLLCKLSKIFSLSASECEWAENNKGRYWRHLETFPILAKRDKKQNILKRFITRQSKNFKRLLN